MSYHFFCASLPAYFFSDIAVEYEEGSTTEVTLHDGSRLLLKKLDRDYDPTDRMRAIQTLSATQENEVLTGILYVNPVDTTLTTMLNLVDHPLASLPENRVRPSREALAAAMEELR